MTRRILVLNVNTSAAIAGRLAAYAQLRTSSDTVIEVLQPTWGVSSVESAYDAYISVAAGLDRIHQVVGPASRPTLVPWDAMVWAGFGDPGSEAFEDLLGIPVYDLARSAATVASVYGQFAIISTVARMTPLIRNALVGAADTCTGIYTLDLPVAAVGELGPAALIQLLAPVTRRALAEGAVAICLGSGALAGLAALLETECGCPVVDGLDAALSFADVPSPDWSPPPAPGDKDRPGWPIS